MRIVERIRPGAIREQADTLRIRTPLSSRGTPPLAIRETHTQLPLDSREDEVSALQRQLRRAVERNSQQFDQGFAAAVAMVAAGADLERLREASGIVACEYGDTSPIELIMPDDTVPTSLDDLMETVEAEAF